MNDRTTVPTFDEVTSVYSGRDGRCCCGCSGKHYDKGTPAADRMIRKVVRILNERLDEITYGSNNVSVVVYERLYVAYA